MVRAMLAGVGEAMCELEGGREGVHNLCKVLAKSKTVSLVLQQTRTERTGNFQLGNCLEERLLDQAQVRVSYTPPFGGHSRSIPQGMILDVQPLVQLLFCPIKRPPNGLFDSEASIP